MELFSILSGIALAVLAFLPGNGLTPQRKAGVVALGALFAGYGLYVMAQDSGTWRFPAIVFALPFLVGAEVIRELREHRRRAGSQPGPGAAAPTAWAAAPAPRPTTALTTQPTTPVAAPMVAAVAEPCAACGAQLRAGVRFCTRCGAPRVVGPGATPAPVAVPAPPYATAPAPSAGTPLSLTAWPVRIAVGAVGVVVLLVVSLVIRNVLDDGPSADSQFEVSSALMAAATESACVNAAIEGQYFAEEIAAVIDTDTWVDSPAYLSLVEAPFVQLAQTCGYDYGLAALNSIGIVGTTYRAVDGAMLAAAPPVIAEPAPADDGGIKEPTPDEGPLVVGSSVTLWGGGAIGDYGYFAPADSVLTTLSNELGAYESAEQASCSEGAVTGLRYRWGDFVVFVGEEGFTYDHPSGETVTVEAPFIDGWMLTPDGARTGLRTAEGLGKDDSVADLLALYPDAYVAGPGGDGTVAWEYVAGDMGRYVFLTTGETPEDFVVGIRSGSVCS